MFRRFSEWFLFSFIVALVPFWISAIVTGILGVSSNWLAMLRTGELLLITFGLAGTALGELFSKRALIFRMYRAERRERYDTYALYCTFILMAVVAISAASYAIILTMQLGAVDSVDMFSPNTFVLWDSLILFLCTIMCAAVTSAFARS